MNKEQTARKVFDNLVAAFNEVGFVFDKNEEKLTVSCVCAGEGLKINVFVRVDAEMRCVTFFSALPFKVEKNKVGEVGLAICYVNNRIKFGKFDIDLDACGMDYNFCNYYDEGAPMSAGLLKDLLGIALHTVDKYNIKFSDINSGLLPLDVFFSGGEGTVKN